MPTRPPRPCAHPGCPELTASTWCARHERERPPRPRKPDTRPSAHRRGYGRRWERLRRLVLARDPICRICGQAPATEVDHIVPKRRGGPDSMENLQGLCKPCHSRKTARGG